MLHILVLPIIKITLSNFSFALFSFDADIATLMIHMVVVIETTSRISTGIQLSARFLRRLQLPYNGRPLRFGLYS